MVIDRNIYDHIVGEAYVHGIMDGEAIPGLKDPDEDYMVLVSVAN
jgi:hypothetical protein